MVSAFIFGCQPGLHNTEKHPPAHHPSAKAENVGIVVPPCQAGGIIIRHYAGPNAPELVGCNAHTDTGAADQDAPADLSTGDCRRHLCRIVGIPGGGLVPSLILTFIAVAIQILNNPALCLRTGIIACDINNIPHRVYFFMDTARLAAAATSLAVSP